MGIHSILTRRGFALQVSSESFCAVRQRSEKSCVRTLDKGRVAQFRNRTRIYVPFAQGLHLGCAWRDASGSGWKPLVLCATNFTRLPLVRCEPRGRDAVTIIAVPKDRCTSPVHAEQDWFVTSPRVTIEVVRNRSWRAGRMWPPRVGRHLGKPCRGETI